MRSRRASPAPMARNLLFMLWASLGFNRRLGAAMKHENRTFTLLECLMVVAILLFVSGIAIQNLIHSMKASEEKTVHAAETEYSAVRNMYAEKYGADSNGVSGVNTASGASVIDTSVH
jgi:type II secretory pathway pseudopilin PulG